MSRGDHLEIIFRDDQDRELFLATLGEASSRTDWQVHAFCLMSNHFHSVIETPRGNLVEGMKWLLGTYTSRFTLDEPIPSPTYSSKQRREAWQRWGAAGWSSGPVSVTVQLHQ